MTRVANPHTEVYDLAVAYTCKVLGNPVWSSNNHDVIVTNTADYFNAVVSASANGAAIISVDADVDLGGGATVKDHKEVQVIFSDVNTDEVSSTLDVSGPRAIVVDTPATAHAHAAKKAHVSIDKKDK